MKSRVGYTEKPFETLEEAQAWVNRFVSWYNEQHRHCALNWLTPMARHTGAERELLHRRKDTYLKAQQRRPQRWSRGIRNGSPAPAVTLNPRRKNNDVAAAA
jgi:putative transposase